MFFSAVSARALTVDHLRTEYLKNPIGIDTSTPHFSWQLKSDKRSTLQQSYQIILASDPDLQNIVYDSGLIESDKSVNVTLDNLTLKPSTRYYWRVTVNDNHGETAKSPAGSYFETGLQEGGWNDAIWIAPGDGSTPTFSDEELAAIKDYTIETDFEVDRVAAGLIWGATDRNNYYMWQFNTEDASRPLFRPHVWNGGNPRCLEEKEMSVMIRDGEVYHLRIEVADGGTTARTYIDGTLIDERSGNFPYGTIGMRSSTANTPLHNPERAYFDDFKLTASDGRVLFEDNFTTTENFNTGRIVRDQIFVSGPKNVVFQNNFTPDQSVKDYTFEGKFTIDQVAAGVAFAAKDEGNFYMWQFNLENGNPRFRPHVWSGNNPACLAEIDLSGKVDMKYDEECNFKIIVSGNGTHATTYLNGVEIDSRTGNFAYDKVGFRMDEGEKVERAFERSYFDNIVVTTSDGKVVYSENFDDPANSTIPGGAILGGRLRVGTFSESYLWASTNGEASNLRYDIDADITLLNDAASLIFSYTKPNCYFMWAINTNDRGYPLVRRHLYANSSDPQFSDTRINGQSNSDFLGVERHLRLEIDGNIVRTYIDDTLVDTYTDGSGLLTNGLIGFRVYKGEVDEKALWDNVKVTVYNADGSKRVTLDENFDSGSKDFSSAEIVDGKLYSYSTGGQSMVLQDAATASPRFRTQFTLGDNIRSARLYTSGLGVYNLFINGKRVGHPQADGSTIYDELMPGWTDYRSTVFYVTHDVTDLLKKGENAMGAVVSTGWWQGQVSHGIYPATNLGFIAKLVIELNDGETVTIVTDPKTWKSTCSGSILSGDIYHGEIYDARREDAWTAPDYDTSLWFAAAADRQTKGKLISFEGPAVRIRPEMQRKPLSYTVYEGTKSNGTAYGEINIVATHKSEAFTIKKGQTVVVDFGQNASGWAHFKVKGNSGTKMTLRFAEMINDSGDTERGNDGPKGSLYRIALRSAKAMGQYTLCGNPEGEEYQPSTTFYGFRYCDITATDDVELQWMVAETVGTETEEASSLTSNNADVNKLLQNILWGQRSNFVSVPTDCPQRDERLGWTADTQVFSMAASYNAQVQGFYHKWMRDMRDGQLENGAYPNVAPFNWVEHGSSSWADAGIILPWNVYTMYGDKAIIEENFESMERYMAWLESRATNYKYNGADTRYGDWLCFEPTDNQYISTAQHGYMLDIMSKMSAALSTSEGDEYAKKAEKYAAQFEEAREEFAKRYTSFRTHKVTATSQCGLLLPLRYNLISDDETKAMAISDLRKKIEGNNNTLSTGFVGTSIINQTLSEYGMDDLAYALLLQHNCPSWLYSVDQGATTMWERWNSYTLEGGFNKQIEMNSFNHYAYGAVGEWMYRYMAGIGPDYDNPGFKHIIMYPRFDSERRISEVDASFASNYGDIKSAWKTDEDGSFILNVTVPANTTATLMLPLSSAGLTIYEDGTPAAEAEGISDYAEADGMATMTLGSGSYNFSLDAADGIEEVKVENSNFTLTPNPAHDTVRVNGSSAIETITIHSVTGTKMASLHNTDTFNVGSLAPALYLVTVTDAANHTQTLPLIKK